ncbi:hypothetical protein [Actinomadura rudentiformis]|nr:hypothetical protein [Actinomadura rudentiformis]
MRRIVVALVAAGLISGGFAALAASPAAADKIWSNPASGAPVADR